jgi:transposase-like protein
MSSKKTYTSEFKEEAVRLAQQRRHTSETARNLGVPSTVLRRWKKELAQDGEQT